MLTRWKRQSAVIQRMVLSLRIDYTRAMNVNIIALSVKTGLLALRHTQLSRCSLCLSVIVSLNVNIFVAVLLSLVYQSNSHSNTASDCRRRWIAKGKRKQQLIYQQTRRPTSSRWLTWQRSAILFGNKDGRTLAVAAHIKCRPLGSRI